MPETPSVLTLSVDAGQSADLQETAELTRRLRQILLDNDVDSVDLVRGGDAPPGPRATSFRSPRLPSRLRPSLLPRLLRRDALGSQVMDALYAQQNKGDRQ